ncbi:MAG: hypothetical protein O7H41_11715 [Planctomycetota bacterium]|nr:hypothetical protein [Planctomycetota bacterium]
MKIWICLLALMFVVSGCSRGPTGPTPSDIYEGYKGHFNDAQAEEKRGDRYEAIQEYILAKKALEDLGVKYPDSMLYDERELARVKEVIKELKDEERRGVEAVIAGQEGPPPIPEPEMSGELFHSIKGAIETKIGALTKTDGKLTNDELDRVKRVEPFVVDNTPALVIHILTNSRLIPGMQIQQCEREMKEVLRVIRTHRDELGAFKLYTFSGFKAIEGAGGYAEPVLLFEYRFTPEDFDKIDWAKLMGEEGEIGEMATETIEP